MNNVNHTKRVWLCRALANSGANINALKEEFTDKEIQDAIYGGLNTS